MYRFYISPDCANDTEIIIEGSDVNHIKNVLRLEPGDFVVACDGQGRDYVSRIKSLDRDSVNISVEQIRPTGTELGTKIVLFQGLPKKDKMEWIIQKAVELGAAEIVPVAMKRCVMKMTDDKKTAKKIERWQSIAQAAAKQCDRGIIPVIHEPVNLNQAFGMASKLQYNLIPYELAEGIQESREEIAKACQSSSIGIFIGPEGGFDSQEVEDAIKQDIHPITLGKRILRTETAGMALLSILMFQLQE